MGEIVLASTSPRRRMLLEQVGIQHVVIPPKAVERTPTDSDFGETVRYNAEQKARSVISLAAGRVILGADTVVDLDGSPLGKPVDAGDARQKLKSLSGRDHRVHSGIAVIDPTRGIILCDHVVTRVWFRELADAEIEAYIRTHEPFDKAGAYGIQARGALFIERIEGCFFNVMGLPLARLWEMLTKDLRLNLG